MENNQKKNSYNKLASAVICAGILLVMALVFFTILKGSVGKKEPSIAEIEETDGTEAVQAENGEIGDEVAQAAASDIRTGTLPKENTDTLSGNTASGSGSTLQQTKSWIAANPDGAKVDYSQIKYKPGQRNASLKWSDSFYTKIENPAKPEQAAVNGYTMTRRQAMLDNGMYMMYEVFTNPENGKNEKIISIEYCGDHVNVVSYYFDNDKLNYAFSYTNEVYVPGDIFQVTTGDRYCIVNDTLVRYITDNGEEKMDLNLKERDNYSDGTRETYDYQESKIINDAYITYQAVKDIPETALIEGYVLDEFNTPMADVEIQIYSNQAGEAAKLMTNGDGYYKAQVPLQETDTYTVSARKNTLETVRINGVLLQRGSLRSYMPTIYMAYAESGSEYNLELTVLTADSGSPAAGTEIKVFDGFNARSGDALKTVSTDGSGKALLTMQAGNYTAQLYKGGYEYGYCNIVVKKDSSTMTAYLAPEVPEGQYYAVLSSSDPALSITGHLFAQKGSSLEAGTSARATAMTDMGSNYKFFVTDNTSYQNQNSASYSLSTAAARVEVYAPTGLLQTYYAPAGSMGVVWDVFDLRGGKLMPTQIYNTVFYERLFQK